MKITKEIKLISLYTVLFISIIFIIKSFFNPELLNTKNFLNSDAEHYYWIKNFGYEGFRVAFFPLFPMIWKVLSLSIIGIVFFNSLLFLCSFYALIRVLKATPIETLLYLTIPSLIFCYLPYTESVFFASSTLLFIGLKKKRLWLVLIGLFLCTLSRPAFVIFIPALIIAEFLTETIDKKMFIRIIWYISIALLGNLIVGMIQYSYTGKWFEFFEVQQGWGNKLQIPKLPLTSWAGGLIVRLDGAAMVIGTVSGIVLLLKMFNVKFLNKIAFPKEIIFSLAYLGGITLSVLLFRGGSLFSLNRFVFAVPFIIIVLNYFYNLKFQLDKKALIIGFSLIFIFFFLFGSYGHIQTLLRFLFLSFYLFLILALKSENILFSKFSIITLIGLNVFFQLYFYIRFLNNGWVG